MGDNNLRNTKGRGEEAITCPLPTADRNTEEPLRSKNIGGIFPASPLPFLGASLLNFKKQNFAFKKYTRQEFVQIPPNQARKKFQKVQTCMARVERTVLEAGMDAWEHSSRQSLLGDLRQASQPTLPLAPHLGNESEKDESARVSVEQSL